MELKGDKIGKCWGILLDQILLFPTTVVVLTSVVLLLGGKCALWQWWGAMLVVLAYPFWKNSWKRATVAGVLFLGVLFAIWIWSGISVTREWWDCHTYHYPAIRMLMLGWNPIWESTREAIEAFCGQPDCMNIWPVVSMPRPVWYFSAVAAFFTQNHFDYYHPIILFSLAGSFGCFCRAIKGTGFAVRVVSAIFIFSLAQLYSHALDVTMSLAALGLFSCQYAYLKHRRCYLLAMVCSSFWMCSAKQTGIAFCAVSWGCFAGIIFVREHREWRRIALRLLKIGGAIAGLCLVANVSPYVTSSVHYGHPLYPQFTTDPVKFPAVNFTADFFDVNEDAKAMANRPAMFINAFVSSDLVKHYYEWKLNRPGFRPKGWTWKFGGGTDGWDTQLNPVARCWVMIPIVLMLIMGGLAERFVSVVMLLCALIVPVEMIGLLRYVDMMQFSLVFCLAMAWDLSGVRRMARLSILGAMCWIGWGRICDAAKVELELIDNRVVICDSFLRGLPDTLYYNKFALRHKVFASLDLMKRLVPRMRDVKLETLPDELYNGVANTDLRARSKLTNQLNRDYPRFPDWSFRVPKWYGVDDLSELGRIRRLRHKPAGVWAGSLNEFKIFWLGFARIVPRAIWLRLSGMMNRHMREDGGYWERTSVCRSAALDLLNSWGVNVVYDRSLDDKALVRGSAALKLTYPRWLKRGDAQGISVEGSGQSGSCALTFTSGGEVAFHLKGIRVADGNSKVLPVYADFESFQINGVEMLDRPVLTLHDKPHKILYHVNRGDTLEIFVRLRPHAYGEDQLRQLLLDAADVTFVSEGDLADVMSAPEIAQYVVGNGTSVGTKK